MFNKKQKSKNLKSIIIGVVIVLGAVTVYSASHDESSQDTQSSSSIIQKHESSKVSEKSSSSASSAHKSSSEKPKEKPVQVSVSSDILSQLVKYTDEKSSGPNKNYYYENGNADTKGFEGMKPGETSFTSDNQGRSATAKAILTYREFEDSKGKRQGKPLAPPSWPAKNPKVEIHFELTGRVYHGYLYNRSHSIADSLLGKKSYTSPYNFTTGTRSQNVGANQNGGMRYAEELAEKYWKSHANTNQTINYKTTPVYKDNETIPRGSIVDIKSSDGTLDKEIIVINSEEGFAINYNDSTFNKTENTQQAEEKRKADEQAAEAQRQAQEQAAAAEAQRQAQEQAAAAEAQRQAQEQAAAAEAQRQAQEQAAAAEAQRQAQEQAAQQQQQGQQTGYSKDANGRWHRPNGQFASKKEIADAGLPW